MRSGLFNKDLLRNSEYQSALVRIAIWVFSVTYIGLGAWTQYYAVDIYQYYLLFGSYFLIFLGLLISIHLVPEWRSRRYITVVTDISAASLAIFLTNEAISPFYLLYIWIFVSYGTRYGRNLLMVASILSVLAYNIVLIVLNEWQRHTFEAFFFLLVLIVLPMYQYSLLRKLHEARMEAERANKARGDFLATMTHELRTPLIGVIGMVRLLQTTPMDAEQKDYLHSIKSSAHLLRSLIGDILDFSKIDANKLELEIAPFDLRDLVRNITSTLATEAQEKHVELLCRIESEVPRELTGDRLRVSQILYNLLGNAIKFTDRGEVALRVSVESSDEQIVQPHILLEVEDTGVGIPQEKLEKIFDMFWQADISTSRRFGGTGLGTTVARDLTQMMGGRISVRSRLGEGTVFSVRLPLLPEQGVNLDVKPPQLTARRLLIFETNETSMQAYLDMTLELGMEAVPVTTLEALSHLQETEFDLALVCDSLDGIPMSLLFRRLDALLDPRIPVLFGGYRGRTVSLPDRVSGLLLKPFIADQLAEVSLNLLAKATPDAGLESPASAPETGQVQESGVRILLAEDNSIAAKVFQTLLTRRGHQVTTARDGVEALSLALAGGYHLAFIDLRMPHMDGLEFTRQYRAQEPEKMHLPILALTANTAEDVLSLCIEVGMDGFLNKSGEPERLDEVIAHYVQAPEYNRLPG